MFIKSQVELIYQGQGVAENGSPLILEESKVVRCEELETFSNSYYNDQQRNMRTARNLVVPTYYVDDLIINGKRYELMYVNYHDRKYKVRNILKFNGRYNQRTRQKMILDVQEVR